MVIHLDKQLTIAHVVRSYFEDPETGKYYEQRTAIKNTNKNPRSRNAVLTQPTKC
jgi:hypothetical protein